MNVMNLGTNDWVTCPFDPIHRMKYSRFHNHFVKCRKQHPDDIRKQCPYNASELVDIDDYENHLSQCPFQSLYFNIGQVVDDLPEYDAPSHFNTDPIVLPAKIQNQPVIMNFDGEEEIDSVSTCGRENVRPYFSMPQYSSPSENNVSELRQQNGASPRSSPECTATSGSQKLSLEKKGFGRGAWIKRMLEKRNLPAANDGSANFSDETSATTSNVSSSEEDDRIAELIRKFKEDPFSISKQFGRGRGAIFQTLIYD